MFEGVKKVFKDPKTFFKEKCLAFAKFLYNPETKEVLGRSCLGWGKFILCIHLVVTVSCLLLTFLLLSVPSPLIHTRSAYICILVHLLCGSGFHLRRSSSHIRSHRK